METSADLLLKNNYFICFAGLGSPIKSFIYLSFTCAQKIDRVFRSGQRKNPFEIIKFLFPAKILSPTQKFRVYFHSLHSSDPSWLSCL
jgi:hypothetical protein